MKNILLQNQKGSAPGKPGRENFAAHRNGTINRFPAQGMGRVAVVWLAAALMIAFMTGAVSESQATVTVYQAQNSDGSGNLDTICDKNTFDHLRLL